MKTHDNQKPYQCVYCNRGYNTAAALTSHLQNHKKEITSLSGNTEKTSNSIFRCLRCNIIFTKSEELYVNAFLIIIDLFFHTTLINGNILF